MVIPYEGLGDIKNTIPEPAGFGLRPQPLGCGMVFLIPPARPYGIYTLYYEGLHFRFTTFAGYFGSKNETFAFTANY